MTSGRVTMETTFAIDLILLLASLMRASTLFSPMAGKSQNLSDVRSEACAVDWSSYHSGYSLPCDDIT